jgi:hypothetical protein
VTQALVKRRNKCIGRNGENAEKQHTVNSNIG